MTANTAFSIFKEKYASDIRFWIVVFFIVRLYGISNPPIEIGHSWRQSLTNMVARNFLEVDNNILYPRIDMDGDKTGIIASEFPLFNYLIYLWAKIFGYAHWYGRLINLLITSIGLYYFFKLVKRFFTEELSFYATLILMCSIWFAFARKSMPDTFCMSLVIIGVYNGFFYLYDGKFRNLLGFFLFSVLAVLSKIPALYLLSILVIPLFDKNVKFYLKRNILFAGMLILFFVYAWYFYWVPYLLATYGFQLYFPKHFMEGISELIHYGSDTLEKFYFSALQSFIAFVLFIVGLFIIIKQKLRLAFSIVLVATLFFILFIIKTGFVFSVHNYYVIPFVPVMAFVAAFTIVKIKNRNWRVVLVGLIMIESIANQQHDFFIKDSEKYKLSLEKIVNSVSAKNDLIVINGGKNPQLIYFAHRKGWSVTSDSIMDNDFMNEIINKGCYYLFMDKHDVAYEKMSSQKDWKIVFENEDFVVHSLRN